MRGTPFIIVAARVLKSVRGTACALIALATITALLVSCQHDGVSTGSTARIDFSSLPDGPPPKQFGSGSSTVITTPEGDSAARFRIRDGKLTTEPMGDGPSASYFTSASLGSPVTNIGARWSFTGQRGTPGTMLLIVSQTAFKPPFAIQLEVTPLAWSIGIRPPGALDVGQREILRSEPFKSPLSQNGSDLYECQVWIAGDRAEIELPNGERRSVRDVRIAEWAGAFATFVAYAGNGQSDSRVGFSEVWAESKTV